MIRDDEGTSSGTSLTSEGMAARHSSKSVEHHTPPSIVEPARVTLGGFDLDPFSCVEANAIVRATAIYTGPPGVDGWTTPWMGRVFCNPPGGRGPDNSSNQKRAWFRLMSEYAAGRVTSAIFICFSIELLQTTQVNPTGPLPLDFPICFPSRRIAYVKPDGTVGGSPPHSSCVILVPPRKAVVYIGDAATDVGAAPVVTRFKQAFAPIGKVTVPS